ncbi:MAG: response regulator transcription factor [Candidatus Liptonbacteria bacterium]|nr:response regulator transcription factor [Candidatus Liptonbacteria bacterium]
MNPQKKILVVEDDKFLLEMLSGELKKEGYTVLTAKDGKSGLALALGEKPDLILLDLLLPVMDGFSMLQELNKKSDARPPVMVLSNLSDLENVEKVRLQGVRDYLVKTAWTPEELLKKVNEKLGA